MQIVLLTTLCTSNSIQSNIKCLVDSTMVRNHTMVDPRHTVSVTVQSYQTSPPGYVEQPPCTIRWDLCSIGEVPVSSFCSWTAGYVVWRHTEQWIVIWSAELPRLTKPWFETVVPFKSCTKWEVDQMGIDQMGIDQMGIDQMGIDKVGIDKVGITLTEYVLPWSCVSTCEL